MKLVRSPAELYAHAIAIEREAAGRYAELAARMRDESNEDLAALFAGLAKLEAGHLEALERRTDGIALPPLTRTDYKWLGAERDDREARLRLEARRAEPRGLREPGALDQRRHLARRLPVRFATLAGIDHRQGTYADHAWLYRHGANVEGARRRLLIQIKPGRDPPS